MASVKDKVVTVESLSALHDYNEETYRKKEDIVPIEKGGTNSDNGAVGLKNLFAAGETVLSEYQYGDVLPAAGNAGRIFFKRLINIINFTIDGLGTLEAEEGMTWAKYCDSDYNTIGLYTDVNNYLYVFKDTGGTKYYLAAVMAGFGDTVDVDSTELIDSSTEYVLVEYLE